MAEGEKPEETAQAVVRISWGDSTQLEPLYANHVMVSHFGGKEFLITFGQLLLPATFDTPAEAEIRPVARLVITPERFPEFVEAMQRNLKRYAEGGEIDDPESDRHDGDS